MAMADRIVARRNELGISQAELARRVGVSQPLITEIEKGRVRDSKHVIEIAIALGLSPSELDPRYSLQLAGAGIAIEPLGDVPVFSLVRQQDQSIILPEPINFLPRPAGLQHVRGAYALMVTDDEMAPEFEPGDVAFVNPHLPALEGYSYVFSAQPSQGHAAVRRLLDNGEDIWRLKMWNPKEGDAAVLEVPKSTWPCCQRVIGKHSRG